MFTPEGGVTTRGPTGPIVTASSGAGFVSVIVAGSGAERSARVASACSGPRASSSTVVLSASVPVKTTSPPFAPGTTIRRPENTNTRASASSGSVPAPRNAASSAATAPERVVTAASVSVRGPTSPMRTTSVGWALDSAKVEGTGPDTRHVTGSADSASSPSSRTLVLSAGVASKATVEPTMAADSTVPAAGSVAASPTSTVRPGETSSSRSRTPGSNSPAAIVRPTSIVSASTSRPGRKTVPPVSRSGKAAPQNGIVAAGQLVHRHPPAVGDRRDARRHRQHRHRVRQAAEDLGRGGDAGDRDERRRAALVVHQQPRAGGDVLDLAPRARSSSRPPGRRLVGVERPA